MPKYSSLPFETKLQKREKRLRTTFPKPLEKFQDLVWIVERRQDQNGDVLLWDISINSLVNSNYFKVYKINKIKVSYEISKDILDIINFEQKRNENALFNEKMGDSLKKRSLNILELDGKINYSFNWEILFDGHVIEAQFTDIRFKKYGFSTDEEFINFLGYIKLRVKSKIDELSLKFDRSIDDIHKLIAKLLEDGIIKGKITKKEIKITGVIKI